MAADRRGLFRACPLQMETGENQVPGDSWRIISIPAQVMRLRAPFSAHRATAARRVQADGDERRQKRCERHGEAGDL